MSQRSNPESFRRATRAVVDTLERRCMLAAVPAASADAFVESVGLNGGGGDFTVTDAQRYREYGFRHVRTAQVRFEDSNWVSKHNQAFDQYGLRWLMTINKEPTPSELVSRFKQFTPGSIAMMEGNNEVDNTAFYGGNAGYEQIAQNAQPGYWDAMKADAATRDTPLAIYSTLYSDWHGYSTVKADLGNIHYYPGPLNPPMFVNGYNDFFTARGRNDAAIAGPEKGFIVGEAGYSTYRFGPMSRAAQAKGDTMLMAEYFKQGVPRTFLFSFYGSNEGFELYNQPAGNAVKYLLNTLGEATWNDPANTWSYPSFNPGNLDFTISGGNDSVRSQLLQKSNGDFYLMLWQSKGVADGSGNDINNADVNVTLNFKTALNSTAVVHRMTPSTGNYSTSNNTISGSAGSQSLTVAVPDSVILVKLDPTAASPFAQTGTLYQEIWTGVSGGTISSVPVQNAPNQVNTLTQLEGTYSGDNYGSRMRGYITAPTDGLYTFWVSGDDNVELRLSRLPDSARDLQTIATVPGWTNSREWGKYAEQKSVPIAMQRGRKYYFEVVHKEGSGGDSVSVGWAKPGEPKSAPSQVVPGSVLSPAPTSLPSGWMNADVGKTDLSGTASESGGTFALQGNGADIWGTSDQFHYAYKSLDGNGDVIARVTQQQLTDAWAKSGLMIRDGIGGSDSFAFLFVTPSNGIRYQYRNGTGTTALDGGGVPGVSSPVWLKLSRNGNAFSAYYSTNGTSWTQVGSTATVGVSTNAKAGLAALSHNVLATNSVTFTNVSVGTQSTPAAPIGRKIGFRATTNNRYVSSDQGDSTRLKASWATSPGSWEEFDIVDAGGGKVAIKSRITGKFVTADQSAGQNGALRADWATSIGSWEQFEWVDQGSGQFALKASISGLFVQSDQNDSGRLRAIASTVGTWERFDWIDLGAS